MSQKNLPPQAVPQEPMPFEEIEKMFHGHVLDIMQNSQMLPGTKLDALMQVMTGCMQEMLTTLKSHHPGKPLIIPKGH